jgi:hypothetical protein
MVFAEFLETLARIALIKWRQDGVAFSAKYEMAIQSVAGLWNELPRLEHHHTTKHTKLDPAAASPRVHRISLRRPPVSSDHHHHHHHHQPVPPPSG